MGGRIKVTRLLGRSDPGTKMGLGVWRYPIGGFSGFGIGCCCFMSLDGTYSFHNVNI